MDKIIALARAGPIADKHDDDLSDRLNCRYSVMFLVVFTIAVSAQLYVGTPINCWCPKEFEGSWIKYTNSYCWVKNTYYLPLEHRIPKVLSEEREAREILYYQWLPFIMIVQAILFYLPSLVWHSFNQKAGVDCDSILNSTLRYQSSRTDAGDKKILELVAKQMDRLLLANKEEAPDSNMKIRNFLSKLICACCKTTGKYLILLYLFTKLLYLGNVVAQFFILNSILRHDYSLYGYELVSNALNDRHWSNSESFPRVTMCDFTVRKLGNNHRYTVQCVLPINMYTEKIYAFLWVWMLFVAVITGLSFIQWLLRLIFTKDKYRYIRGHLRHTNAIIESFPNTSTEEQKHAVEKFVNDYLNHDGVFVLRLIGHNTSNLTVSDVIKELFQHWLVKNKKIDAPEDPSPPTDLDDVDGHDPRGHDKAAEAGI